MVTMKVACSMRMRYLPGGTAANLKSPFASVGAISTKALSDWRTSSKVSVMGPSTPVAPRSATYAVPQIAPVTTTFLLLGAAVSDGANNSNTSVARNIRAPYATTLNGSSADEPTLEGHADGIARASFAS